MNGLEALALLRELEDGGTAICLHPKKVVKRGARHLCRGHACDGQGLPACPGQLSETAPGRDELALSEAGRCDDSSKDGRPLLEAELELLEGNVL